MPIIKFRSQGEAQEWINIIEHFESVMSAANEENKKLREYYDAQLRTANFWKRYAFERTIDTKLQGIALSSLKQVESDGVLMDSVVPAFMNKMLSFLKLFQPGN